MRGHHITAGIYTDRIVAPSTGEESRRKAQDLYNTAIDADRNAMSSTGEESRRWHRKAQVYASLALVEAQEAAQHNTERKTMNDYTPSTEEVHDEYIGKLWIEGEVKDYSDDARERIGAEFNRWLAEVERAAAEKAWWEACQRIADGENNLDIADTYQKQNPYLEEKKND